MTNRLYLGHAFGWDTEITAKVAISQLRDKQIISTHDCPKAQLIKNRSYRRIPNTLKLIGYFPGLHIVAGIVAIAHSWKNSHACDPNHQNMWIGRGIAMIIAGPGLLVVDAIKYLFDMHIANMYKKANPAAMQAFNTPHGHTTAYWPGHPIRCIGNNQN